MKTLVIALLLVLGGVLLFVSRDDMSFLDEASSAARDPGPRAGAAGAGSPIAGLTESELALFNSGKGEFEEEEDVKDGLGPTMNLGSCAGCHAQPAEGGTGAAHNVQVAFATEKGGTNAVPAVVTPNGPVREARVVKNPHGTADGGVSDRSDLDGGTDRAGAA